MIGGNSARKIFCAIDTDVLDTAVTLARALGGHVGGIKLGLEFFTAFGPQGVAALGKAVSGKAVSGEAASGEVPPLFLDLKYHDIPNTVAGAVSAAVALKPAFLTLHTTGGAAMLRAAAVAAADAAREAKIDRPLLLGVTELTSLDADDLDDVGLRGPVGERALRLAELAAEAGLDGVVASAREVRAIRERLGPDFKLVVPGIRPAFANGAADQKRTATPAEALAAGADFLVIGRPIAKAPDPLAALRRIVEEIDGKS